MLESNLKPVTLFERVQLHNMLRGFAIFGIFIMNLEAYSWYWTLDEMQKASVALASYDHTTNFIHHMFFEGKFYSIFSMLFGIWFAIYLSKAENNKQILPLFRRRLAILLLIGFTSFVMDRGYCSILCHARVPPDSIT